MKKKSFLAADPVYREQMESYTLKDTALALVYYALFMAAYYWMGREMTRTGNYWGEPVSAVAMLIPVLLCVKKLSGLGITLRNLKPSLLWGAAIGTVYLGLFCVIPQLSSGGQLKPARQILYNVYYYFIIIGLCEEIGFRGFIQPRLFPLFKKEWPAVIVCGVLFTLMHIPFQMTMRNMTLAEYWPRFIENAPLQFGMHFVFTWVYRRYGNIFGGTVLHGLIDMCSGLFM